MKRQLLFSLLLPFTIITKAQPGNHLLQAPSSIVSATPTPLSGNSSYLVNEFSSGQLLWNPQYCDVNSSGFITRWLALQPSQIDTSMLWRFSYLQDSIAQGYIKKQHQDPSFHLYNNSYDTWGRLTTGTIADSAGNTWFSRTNTWGPGPVYKGIVYNNRPPISSNLRDTLLKTRITGPVGQIIRDTLIRFNRASTVLERLRWNYFRDSNGWPSYGISTRFNPVTGAASKQDSLIFNWNNDTLTLSYWIVVPPVVPQKDKTFKFFPAPGPVELFSQNLEFRLEEELSDWLELPGKNYYKRGKLVEEGISYKRTFTQRWLRNPINNNPILERGDSLWVQSFSTGSIDSLASATLQTTEFIPIIQGIEKQMEVKSSFAYPSPSDGLLMLREIKTGSRLTIFNPKGKAVHSCIYTGEPITLEKLATGIYTITSQYEKEPVKRTKWVKW